MNSDILIGVVMLIIGGALIFIGLPNKAGVSPRFLRSDASLPLVLVFVAGGLAELIVEFLRAN